MSKAIKYALKKWAETKRYSYYKSIPYHSGLKYEIYFTLPDGVATRRTITLDLAWWAEVPIEIWGKYMGALEGIILKPLKIPMWGDISSIEREIGEKAIHNAPIPLRCQALYESEVGK